MNVPQQPLPQTVCMTLEHSGVPVGESELITDIPPDFNWMSQIQTYDFQFRYQNTDEPQKELANFEVHNMITRADGNPEWLTTLGTCPWQAIPFLCSKWWNGTISYKFIAIKPPRVTGKLLIRYSFDPSDTFENDTKRRSVAKEWDLGTTSECEFKITAVNTIRARPTWIPKVKTSTDPGVAVATATQYMPKQTWHMGRVSIEAAQRLQVGSIFPDSIRILVFRVFELENVYMPTDFRGNSSHFLAQGTSLTTANTHTR